MPTSVSTNNTLGTSLDCEKMNSSAHSLACGYPFNTLGLPEWRRSFLTREMFAALISVTIFNLLLFPLTVLLNVLVIIAVKTRPSLTTKYNGLLACLAGTDFTTGLLGHPLVIAEQIYRLTDSSESVIFQCVIPYAARRVSATFLIISLQHLALISIERYIAVKYTFKYDDIITKHRLITAVILAWSQVFATIFVALCNIDTLHLILRVLTVFPTVSILIFCHIAVYYEARKQMQKIKAQQMSLEAKTAFLKEKKALKTTTLVIGLVLLCSMPATLFRTGFRSLDERSPMTFLIIDSFLLTLILCNSLFNPLVYCIRNSEYRRAFKKLLFRSNHVQPF